MISNKFISINVDISQSGKRLDVALVFHLPGYSRSQIKRMIINRQVQIDKKVITEPDIRVLGKEKINIYYTETQNHFDAENIKLDVIYQDDFLLIINKPSNMVVHPGAGNPKGTILNALLYHFPNLIKVPRSGIIHRLDKDTTGLMLVAKTTLVYTMLVEALRIRSIVREYEAIACGNIYTNGVVQQPIRRHVVKRTYMAVHCMGKQAITYYRVIKNFRMHTRLKLILETGRTHQIRVHMAYINHPLVGDQKYGKSRTLLRRDTSVSLNKCLFNFNRQALHATLLRFKHPMTNDMMAFCSPLPQDMQMLIQELKYDLKSS